MSEDRSDHVPPSGTRRVKAILFGGAGVVRHQSIDLAKPGPHEAVVRTTMSAVCGSDLPHYRNPASTLGHRLVTAPGHESVGIVEVAAALGGPAEGTRVIVYQHSGCSQCEHCLRGEPMFCRQRQTLGNHRHGADASYVIAPMESLIPIPDDIDDPLAALVACNFGTAFMGFRTTGASVGDRVAVVGLGPVGACVVASAAAAGADVIAIDPIDGRRRLATRLGAVVTVDPLAEDPVARIQSLTDGEGAEIVIDCSANPHAQRQAMKSARVHGTVLLLGANNLMEIDPGLDVIRKELRLLGSWVFKKSDVPAVFRAAQSMTTLRSIISTPFPAHQASEAFAAAAAGHVGKVLLDWSQSQEPSFELSQIA